MHWLRRKYLDGTVVDEHAPHRAGFVAFGPPGSTIEDLANGPFVDVGWVSEDGLAPPDTGNVEIYRPLRTLVTSSRLTYEVKLSRASRAAVRLYTGRRVRARHRLTPEQRRHRMRTAYHVRQRSRHRA